MFSSTNKKPQHAPGMLAASQATEDVNKAMRQLRDSMKGIQIRTAGFKKHHDEAARMAAKACTDLMDAYAAMNKGK